MTVELEGEDLDPPGHIHYSGTQRALIHLLTYMTVEHRGAIIHLPTYMTVEACGASPSYKAVRLIDVKRPLGGRRGRIYSQHDRATP